MTDTIPAEIPYVEKIGNREETAWSVYDAEAMFYSRLPGEIPNPMLFFMLVNPSGKLLPAIIPYTERDITAAVHPTTPQYQRFTTFLCVMASQMVRLNQAKFAEAVGFRPGQQLWFTGVLADVITVRDPERFPDAKDFATDIPESEQIHERLLFGADGLGNCYKVTRRTGEPGPRRLITAACVPDVERIGVFLPAQGPAEQGWQPWAIATMAIAWRKAFRNI